MDLLREYKENRDCNGKIIREDEERENANKNKKRDIPKKTRRQKKKDPPDNSGYRGDKKWKKKTKKKKPIKEAQEDSDSDKDKFEDKIARRMTIALRNNRRDSKTEEQKPMPNQVGRLMKCDCLTKEPVCPEFTIGTPRGSETSNDSASDTQTTKYYTIATPDKDEDEGKEEEEVEIVNLNENGKPCMRKLRREGDHAGDLSQSKAAEL